MNIVVVLKQTPDTESVIRIAPDGRSIVTEGLKWIVNPYDEFAIEAALRLKEKHGGTVSLVAFGSSRVVEAIRTGLAMGADSGVLIDDPVLLEGDLLGATRALAAAVKELDPQVVLTGSRAVDYDQALRGPMIAEYMDWPHLANAISIECDGSSIRVERAIEGGVVTLEADLPVLVSVGGSHLIWNPRYASLPGIMKAKKKPLAMKKLADLGLDPAEFGAGSAKTRITSLERPAERPPGRVVGGDLDAVGKAEELVRLLHEEARVI